MSRTLTAQDCSVLIKLAAGLPVGSEERRTILAALGGSSDLSSLMENLSDLAALDEVLTAVTDSVQGHFRIASEIHPEVASHTDALRKATQGLEVAQKMLSDAGYIASMFPDDKTAQRAKADASTMVKRFTGHVEDAKKILRTIAQKQIPPALKEAATKVKSALTKILVDPSRMEISYEVVPVSNYNYAMDRHIHTVSFRVYFTIETNNPLGFKLILKENAVGFGGVGISTGTVDFSKPYTGPAQAVDMVQTALKGWSGLVGASDANDARAKLAATIATLLDGLANRAGYGVHNAKVRGNGAVVEGHFQSDLPKYGAYDVGEYAYGNMVKAVIGNWRKVLDPALAPYQSSIQHPECAGVC